MQCPFLMKAQHFYCKTGSFGLMAPQRQDYKKHCCNSDYYRCKVYMANTGVGDLEKCRLEIAGRLIESIESEEYPLST